ncbi:TBC1D13, partial [Symbiodinium sp. CCMP2456]
RCRALFLGNNARASGIDWIRSIGHAFSATLEVWLVQGRSPTTGSVRFPLPRIRNPDSCHILPGADHGSGDIKCARSTPRAGSAWLGLGAHCHGSDHGEPRV